MYSPDLNRMESLALHLPHRLYDSINRGFEKRCDVFPAAGLER